MPYRFDLARFIFLVLMILLFFVLFSFGGLYGPYPAFPLNSSTLVFLLTLVLMALAMSFVRVMPQEEDVEVVTEARCPTCGFVVTRPFAKGDYVSKQDKPCPKDGTTTLIEKIYVNDQQHRQPY